MLSGFAAGTSFRPVKQPIEARYTISGARGFVYKGKPAPPPRREYKPSQGYSFDPPADQLRRRAEIIVRTRAEKQRRALEDERRDKQMLRPRKLERGQSRRKIKIKIKMKKKAPGRLLDRAKSEKRLEDIDTDHPPDLGSDFESDGSGGEDGKKKGKEDGKTPKASDTQEAAKLLAKRQAALVVDAYQEPTLGNAKLFRDLHHLRKMNRSGDLHEFPLCTSFGRHCVSMQMNKCDPCCEGTRSQLSAYGAGMSNYFKLLKWWFWMYFIGTILYSPLLYINWYGGHFEESLLSPNVTIASEIRLTATKLTIGNLGYPPEGVNGTFLMDEIVTVPYLDRVLTRGEVAFVYAGADFLFCLCFLIGYYWLRQGERAEAAVVDREFLTADEYSIVIPWVPPDTREEELGAFLEMKLNVRAYQVYIVHDFGGKLRVRSKMSKILNQIENIDESLGRLARIDARVQAEAQEAAEAKRQAEIRKRKHELGIFDTPAILDGPGSDEETDPPKSPKNDKDKDKSSSARDKRKKYTKTSKPTEETSVEVVPKQGILKDEGDGESKIAPEILVLDEGGEIAPDGETKTDTGKSPSGAGTKTKKTPRSSSPGAARKGRRRSVSMGPQEMKNLLTKQEHTDLVKRPGTSDGTSKPKPLRIKRPASRPNSRPRSGPKSASVSRRPVKIALNMAKHVPAGAEDPDFGVPPLMPVIVDDNDAFKRRKKREKLNAKRDKLMAKSAALRKDMMQSAEAGAIRAYVTFEEKSSARAARRKWRANICSYYCMRKDNKFRGLHRLKIREAPVPSTVLWENIATSKCSQFLRMSITTLISIILMGGTVAMLFVTRELSSTDNQTQNADGTTTSTSTSPLALAAPLLLVGVNVAMNAFMRILAGFEHHHSVIEQERSIFSRLFQRQLVNTAILILLVNANFEPLVKPLGLDSILTPGPYSDFDPEWYKEVGFTLSVTLSLQIFAPFVIGLAKHALQSCIRFMLRHGCLPKRSQRSLNNAHIGPIFRPANRYAKLMVSFFATMLYSPGMPIMMPIGVCVFSVSYVLDKFMVLRVYRTPPYFDAQLGRDVSDLFLWALLFHLLISIWTFTTKFLVVEDGFALRVVFSFLPDQDKSMSRQAFEQVWEYHVLPLLFLLVAVVGLLIRVKLGFFFGKCLQGLSCGAYNPNQSNDEVETFTDTGMDIEDYMAQGDEPTLMDLSKDWRFTEATNKKLLRDLPSYDIRDNPDYKDAFQEASATPMHGDTPTAGEPKVGPSTAV